MSSFLGGVREEGSRDGLIWWLCLDRWGSDFYGYGHCKLISSMSQIAD